MFLAKLLALFFGKTKLVLEILNFVFKLLFSRLRILIINDMLTVLLGAQFIAFELNFLIFEILQHFSVEILMLLSYLLCILNFLLSFF